MNSAAPLETSLQTAAVPLVPPLWLAALLGAVVGLISEDYAAPFLPYAPLAALWVAAVGLVFLDVWGQRARLLGLLGLAALASLTTYMLVDISGVNDASTFLFALVLSGAALLQGWDRRRLQPERTLSFLTEGPILFLLAGLLALLCLGLLGLLGKLALAVGLVSLANFLNHSSVQMTYTLGFAAFFAALLRLQPWGHSLLRLLAGALGYLLPVAVAALIAVAAVLFLSLIQGGGPSSGLLSAGALLSLVQRSIISYSFILPTKTASGILN